jgi:hypothetical protein
MPTPCTDRGVSPEYLLNPDGTLRLDDNFSGALDITGWTVALDRMVRFSARDCTLSSSFA